MKTNKEFQSKDDESKIEKETNNYLKNSEFEKTYQTLGIHSYKKSINRDKKIKDRTLNTSNC
mgnify:CR=1 FL=1